MTQLRSFLLRLPLAIVPVFIPSVAMAQGWGVVDQPDGRPLPSFSAAIQAVEQMPMNAALQQRTARMGLQVLNVLWEDTGRSLGSSVGPNISDVTLQVYEPTAKGDVTHLLPVIRFPNFTDKTADVPADKLWVRVGNQSAGSEMVTVPLSEVLEHLREYLSNSESLKGSGNLLAKRDTHFLVSAQHVFVPLPSTGKAEFNPVIFNYQSSPGSPAVMTLLITREGTSMAVIENSNPSYGSGYGQSLFFNKHGQDSAFTVERKSAVKARIDAGDAKPDDAGALEEGADMLMIVQVPLKFAERREKSEMSSVGGFGSGGPPTSAAPKKKDMAAAESGRAVSDVEAAVIGHGEVRGSSREGNDRTVERDDRFPVRVTVQFYKATSNGIISDNDLRDAKAQIDKVYVQGDYVGSLVVPESRRSRPTDWVRGRTSHHKPVIPPVTPVVVTPPVVEPPVVGEPVVPTNPPAAAEASWWQQVKQWWSK